MTGVKISGKSGESKNDKEKNKRAIPKSNYFSIGVGWSQGNIQSNLQRGKKQKRSRKTL
jgi:hypothetical protein